MNTDPNKNLNEFFQFMEDNLNALENIQNDFQLDRMLEEKGINKHEED